MGLVRRMVYVRSHAVRGEWGDPIFEKCPCGKDRRVDTKEHVELETLTLEEALAKYGQPAPCVSRQEGDV